MKTHEKVLRSVLQSPVKQLDDFSLTVNRYYTDSNGLIFDKTDVAIPNSLKTRFPFYLFNKFDKDGFYKIGQQINQLSPNVYFIYQSVWGNGFDLFRFNSLGSIYQNLQPGDFVQIFADDSINFTFLTWIVIRCQNRAYASMIDNIHLSPVEAYAILYGSDNPDQYRESLNIYREDSMGKYEHDYIMPFSYKPPYDTVQNDFLRIPIKHKFHPLHGFASYLQFNTNNLFLNFLVKI
jgi:hypothetical protein